VAGCSTYKKRPLRRRRPPRTVLEGSRRRRHTHGADRQAAFLLTENREGGKGRRHSAYQAIISAALRERAPWPAGPAASVRNELRPAWTYLKGVGLRIDRYGYSNQLSIRPRRDRPFRSALRRISRNHHASAPAIAPLLRAHDRLGAGRRRRDAGGGVRSLSQAGRVRRQPTARPMAVPDRPQSLHRFLRRRQVREAAEAAAVALNRSCPPILPAAPWTGPSSAW